MGQGGSSEAGEKQTDLGYILEVDTTQLADGLNTGREEMRGTRNNALILKIWGLFISVLSIFPCFHSFPASGSFPMSQFFTSDGQSIEASASASVFPMSIQGCFPLGLTSLIFKLSKSESEVAQLCLILCKPREL